MRSIGIQRPPNQAKLTIEIDQSNAPLTLHARKRP